MVSVVNDASSINRRLAAVVFADVAGYSRLLAANESETLRQWKALRTEIMEPYTIRQGGRIAEMAGDALLVEFPSAVNAVRWAADVQRAVKSRQTGASPSALSLAARVAGQQLLALDPRYSVSRWMAWYPLRPDDLERLGQGLRIAGLPD